MRFPPVGIIANPASGRDVRRLLASAGTSTFEEKRSIVRRVVIGAAETGASRFLYLHEAHGICRSAMENLGFDAVCEPLPLVSEYKEIDTIRAAAALREAGSRSLVVLGGDGTNRAVAKGWPDAPVIPLSTGTNNVFPYFAEPTVAGAVAGLLASGQLDLEEVARPAKRIRARIDGEPDDVALIDAVALGDRLVGSMKLFDPETLRSAVFARAEPDAIGLSAIGGLLEPCCANDDHGLFVEFGSPAKPAPHRVRAPTAPGHYADIGVRGYRRLAPGEEVEVEGPCLLGFDGERHRKVPAGGRAFLSVSRDGPRVVDLTRAMRLAAERRLFRSA